MLSRVQCDLGLQNDLQERKAKPVSQVRSAGREFIIYPEKAELPGLPLCFWKDSWDGWRPSGEEPGTSNVLEQPVGAMWHSWFQEFSRTPLRSLMVKEPQTP